MMALGIFVWAGVAAWLLFALYHISDEGML
jgi:hypothetical protein